MLAVEHEKYLKVVSIRHRDPLSNSSRDEVYIGILWDGMYDNPKAKSPGDREIVITATATPSRHSDSPQKRVVGEASLLCWRRGRCRGGFRRLCGSACGRNRED